jgi:hypothetical protein
MVVKMVSYKEMYLEKKRQLEELESNSIDLRTTKILTFERGKWGISSDEKNIILEKC